VCRCGERCAKSVDFFLNVNKKKEDKKYFCTANTSDMRNKNRNKIEMKKSKQLTSLSKVMFSNNISYLYFARRAIDFTSM